MALELKIDKKKPVAIDHKLSDNPYESRYGVEWENIIKETCNLKPYVLITDMIRHIHDESKRIMKGTPHEDNWYFYHDALSLMTSIDTRNWMKQEGIYDRWLLPSNGLNAGTRYENSPVGNSPELMPLDTTLFQDLKLSVQRHVIFTCNLPPNDPKKFTLATISSAKKAYLRILNGSPGSPEPHRIVQDIEKTVNSMKVILDNNGTVVQ